MISYKLEWFLNDKTELTQDYLAVFSKKLSGKSSILNIFSLRNPVLKRRRRFITMDFVANLSGNASR